MTNQASKKSANSGLRKVWTFGRQQAFLADGGDGDIMAHINLMYIYIYTHYIIYIIHILICIYIYMIISLYGCF